MVIAGKLTLEPRNVVQQRIITTLQIPNLFATGRFVGSEFFTKCAEGGLVVENGLGGSVCVGAAAADEQFQRLIIAADKRTAHRAFEIPTITARIEILHNAVVAKNMTWVTDLD